jgi:hypothetical protein
MFGSQIIDVAIGIIFVYLLLSLMCSALNEIIEARLKNRAKSLEIGIRNLLGNDKLADAFYDHALISSLFKDNQKPSYIPSRTFALALMNMVAPQPTVDDGSNPLQIFRETVAQIKDDGRAAPIKEALMALADDAQGDINKLRTNIENWYDDTMDRVSGWYKRRTHTIIIFLGLGIAIASNADSAYIARTLSNDAALRNSLVSAAQAFAANEKPAGPAQQTPAQNGNSNSASNPTRNESVQRNTNANVSTSKNSGSQNNSAALKGGGTATQSSNPPAKGGGATPPTTDANEDKTGAQASKSAQTMFQENLDRIQGLGLPIGWNLETSDPHLKWPGLRIWQPGVPTAWFEQIRFHWLGWVLTALAISLGAPFWFDMLNKLIVVRSTVKPKEKSGDEPSKS